MCTISEEHIAIVGGAGYLGRALFSHFVKLAAHCWVVGRLPKKQSGQERSPAYRCSEPDLAGAIAGASTVFHCASQTTPATGEKNPLMDLENIRFTIELAEACVSQGVHHLVFISSGGTIYGERTTPASESSPAQPICSYGIAKLASEQYLRTANRRWKLRVTVLRLSNLFGRNQVTTGGQGILGYLHAQIASHRRVELLGNTVRDYLYIDDAVRACERAISSVENDSDVFNISTAVGTELLELTRMVSSIMGRHDLEIVVGKRRDFDLAYSVLENDKAARILGWRPERNLLANLQHDLLNEAATPDSLKAANATSSCP